MQHHGAALRGLTRDEVLVERIASDWRSADVDSAWRALLGYAERLTLEPAGMTEADLEELRDEGWTDEAILHAAEAVAYFNLVNRMADGLGVALEPDWPHPLIGRQGSTPS